MAIIDEKWVRAMHETDLDLIAMLCTAIDLTTVESQLYARGIQAKANEYLDYYKDKEKIAIGHDLALNRLIKILIQHLSFQDPGVKDARLEMLELVREWEKHCFDQIRDELEDGNMGY